MNPNETPPASQPPTGGWLMRNLLLTGGVVAVGAGVAGLFLPLLPTTPFLLLAAFCFARSSRRCHHWLLHHPRFGRPLRDYLEGRGIARRTKGLAIGLLWLGLLPSALLLVPVRWGQLLLFAIGLAVSFYLLRLPTARRDPQQH